MSQVAIHKLIRGITVLIRGITVLSLLIMSPPATAQDETTVTGTVASSSRNTVTVRSGTGQFQLFVFDRSTRKPATFAVGSQVRVISSPRSNPASPLLSDSWYRCA